MSMAWARKNWSIISSLSVGTGIVIGMFLNYNTMESRLTNEVQNASQDRDRLERQDEKIERRVVVNEGAISAQGKSLVRIETQQRAIQAGQQQMGKKLDRLDTKLDRLIERRE